MANRRQPLAQAAAERQFVEEFGLCFEQGGLPRIAGRILAWLLICEPHEQSAEDLACAINASKGSVSTMTRMLAEMGMIERVARPLSRRDLYVVRDDGWQHIFSRRMALLSTFRRVAERGL